MKGGKVNMEKFIDRELEVALAYCAYNGSTLVWVKADGSTVKSRAIWRMRAMACFSNLRDNPNYPFVAPMQLSIRWTDTNEMVLSCVQRQEPKVETLESLFARIKECLSVSELLTILKGVSYVSDELHAFLYEMGEQAVIENRRKFNMD
jgi:hypothetical protein